MQFTQASSSHRRTSSIRSRRPLLTAVFLCTAAPLAGASQVAARPGSLLIFPEFDNRPGQNTLLTVTNTHASPVLGNVQVEFVYVDEDTCQEFNRT